MIRAQEVTKRYGDRTALDSVSFEIPPGQVCGYLGPNGAGKSTTVKILTGTLSPSSGQAWVAGFDVSAEALEVKRRIGYVPETGAIYQTLSVEEYLALVGALHHLGADEIASRGTSMLKLFDLAGAARQRIDTLSKGMRQKVVIIGALLHDPQVLLFDEPLSGLDANSVHIIKDLVRGLADRGKTILYCSHVLDVVERLCDRVLILHRGAIVADGSPAELTAGSRRTSLEHVFRDLTTSGDQPEIAAALVNAVHRAPQATADASSADAAGTAFGARPSRPWGET